MDICSHQYIGNSIIKKQLPSMVLVGGELAWSMLYQTSGMISSPCWKVGTEHRHYFVLKLAWHPRLKKPSHVCEHFLNSMIYKHSFRSGSQKGQARTQLQTKSFNLSLMLVGELWDLNSASGKANLLNLHDLCQTILGKG